jgi:predicted RNase H-like nuclease (RuvC/YqgF family)
MHINHFKAEVGAEIEALVAEIKELKERIAKLEHKQFHLETQNMSNAAKHEYIGHWNHKKIEDKTRVTCNTSEII